MNLRRLSMNVPALMAAGILAVFSLGNDQGSCGKDLSTATPAPQCKAAVECADLPHVLCAGAWQCLENQCKWQCSEPPLECATAKDCAGKEPAVDCVGEWACTDGTCKFQCGTPPTCQATGCSGEICAAEPQASDCLWMDWYECLKFTTCGAFGPGGACGFEQNGTFLACLQGQGCKGDADCPEGWFCGVPGCTDPAGCDAVALAPTCLPRETPTQCTADSDCPVGQSCQEVTKCPDCVYANPPCKVACQVVRECRPVENGCHSDGDCPTGQHCSVRDGDCGVDPNCPMCDVCYGKCVPDVISKCVVSGCSGEICAAEPLASTCVWLDWYRCLSLTTCGNFNADGTCGWDQNDAFMACVNGGPVGCQGDQDCKPGERCVFQGCPPCDCASTDPDCACPMCMPALYGTCTPVEVPCQTDADCPAGQACALRDCAAPPECRCDPAADPTCECLPWDCVPGGICVPACIPAKEVCDGLDNDCNGIVDDGCPAPTGCRSDADCLDGLRCALVPTYDAAGNLACCPPNAFCSAEIPPCGYGTCVLDEGRCWTDADCGLPYACEGAIVCPPGAQCFVADRPGTCKLARVGCMDDSQCRLGEFCPIVLSSVQCCPMNAKCTADIPPCLCTLEPGRCWVDADCKAGQACEGATVCPPNAMCFAADQAGKCVDTAPAGCTTDSDCAAGEACDFSGVDVTGCCLPDQVCLMIYAPCQGVCTPKAPSCGADGTCPAGQVCRQQATCPDCYYLNPPCRMPCTIESVCVPQCWTDSDCPAGMACEVLKCAAGMRCLGPYACINKI